MAATSAAMTTWDGSCESSPPLGRHGRTCSGHLRLSLLKRCKQGVDGRDKRGHDDVGWILRKLSPFWASWPDLFRPSTSFFAEALQARRGWPRQARP